MELRKLFLPGTHNSGSYRPYTGHHSDTVFTRYLVCQDEDIKYILKIYSTIYCTEPIAGS